jgi:hypothetical protein
VVARSEAWVWGRLVAGMAGLIPAATADVCLSVVFMFSS